MITRYVTIPAAGAALLSSVANGCLPSSEARERSIEVGALADLAPDEIALPTFAPPEREAGYVEVNGASLYYERQSNAFTANRTPVVLVHGLSLDHSMWAPQYEVLAHFFPVYRYDARGHGRSSAVTAPVALHDDLLGFLDAMGIKRAHLVGLSLGGNVVSEVSAAHPERVERLVLIDSGINGFSYPTPNVLQRIPSYLALNENEGPAAALSSWSGDPLFSVSRQSDAVRPFLDAIVLGCRCSLFFNPHLQVRPDTYGRLGQIAAPTLVLIGELDQPEFIAAANALDELIPDSTQLVIPGAGHMANLDRPLDVTLAILTFLSERLQ